MTACAASSSLALPTLLRHVLRSESGHWRASRSVYRPLNSCRSPSLQYHRSFSSSPLFRDTLNDQSSPGIAESATVTTAPQTRQKNEASTDPGASAHRVTAKKATSHAKGEHDAATKKAWKKERNDSRKDAAKQKPKKKRKPEDWQVQKKVLKEKFSGGWNPPKKLSPDALDGMRHLHATAPDQFTTPVLAEQFKVSPESVRRILKSRWQPSEDEMESRRKRWEKRHDRIWSRMAELGLRPATKKTNVYGDFNVLYDDRKPM